MIILDKFIALIAPFECMVCKKEEEILCRQCMTIFSTNSVSCFGCRAIFDAPVTHENCRIKTSINRLYSVSEYSECARRLILSLKSEGMVGVATVMGRLMSANLPLNDNYIITYLPTASSRVRRRGFDQSRLLAREISKKTGCKNIKFLLRIGQTQQVGSSKIDRLSNISKAFRVTNKKLVKDAKILLVDDVLTTGATLQTAGQVLIDAGAKSVDAVVFAVA